MIIIIDKRCGPNEGERVNMNKIALVSLVDLVFKPNCPLGVAFVILMSGPESTTPTCLYLTIFLLE